MRELTSSPNQDKIWHDRNFTRDAHISPPHLEFALLSNETQVCGDQAYFVNFPSPRSYHSVVVDVAHLFLGITYPTFFSISTWKVSDKKYLKDNLCQKHVLAFIQKENETYANPDYLLVVLCLSQS
jgi:hypothetical protein